MENAKLKKVVWLDSHTQDGWHDPEQQDYAPVTAVTVGFVLHEDKETIALAPSVIFGRHFQATNTMIIPKVCILEEESL